MRIGLDFDNTIVCYEQVIAQMAEKLFDLPKEVPQTKVGLRDHLQATGRGNEWTAFQGELYGPGMQYAMPFEGAIAAMQSLAEDGHELLIISHRSRRPYAGKHHDLHAAARNWVADRLQAKGLFGDAGDEDCVYFLETLDQKIEMITHLGCNVFLDDLPEVLTAPSFPATTLGILFDPAAASEAVKESGTFRITCWAELSGLLLSR